MRSRTPAKIRAPSIGPNRLSSGRPATLSRSRASSSWGRALRGGSRPFAASRSVDGAPASQAPARAPALTAAGRGLVAAVLVLPVPVLAALAPGPLVPGALLAAVAGPGVAAPPLSSAGPPGGVGPSPRPPTLLFFSLSH